MSNEQTTRVEIRLSWPSSSHRFDNYCVLSIRDRQSGMTILEAEMTAEQFASVIANRGAEVPAQIIAEERFHRIGKTYVHERIEVPSQFQRYVPALTDGRREPSQDMRDFAREAIAGTDWEGAKWSRHNYGWELTAYKWVSAEDEGVSS